MEAGPSLRSKAHWVLSQSKDPGREIERSPLFLKGNDVMVVSVNQQAESLRLRPVASIECGP